jgi:thiol-disulfide isomerase/thioredoxin
MKKYFWAAIVTAALVFSGRPALAAETGNAKTELQALVGKIQLKLKDGKKTEAELSAELKEFDDLLARHKAEKTDDVAQILLMKAMLYVQIFDDTDKGVKMFEQLKKDFPETAPGKKADEIIASIKSQEGAKAIQRSLAVGVKFPDFAETDVAGKPMSVASYKGKVVLVDFWATWCGPCVAELPNVLSTYQKNHPKGFEIVGISLDQDKQKLTDFTKSKNMSWQQFFDGKGWGNKLAVKYGVNSIPATFLLDGKGNIIGKDLRGEALDEAVTKALAKK